MRMISHAFMFGGLALSAMLSAAPALSESITEANTALLEAGDEVIASRIPDGIYLRNTNDPDDIIWERLAEYRVVMSPAPAVHESVELRVDYDAEAIPVYLQIARTSDRFYVRMRWRDDSKDTATRMNRFRDGAAIQFSLADDETSYIMGTGPEEPVNIWYWRPDDGSVTNLAAGGPGSTTVLDTQPVSGTALYQENPGDPNEWVVVMSRPLEAAGEHNASFNRERIPMAFAIWQGADGQRDGFKSVSDGWILVDMGDG
ncbi:MAG: ethylbenzene dehydrogenase-related protein [Paracoccaceae bacterium]